METEKHTLYKVMCLECKRSYYFTAEALGALESTDNFNSAWGETAHSHRCRSVKKKYRVERFGIVIIEHGC